MIAWIIQLNSLSADWAAWLWRVCWQATVVIAIAWTLATAFHRWSPRLRSWIWRLAYLKLLLLLMWTTPVKLAILPAAESSGFEVQGSALAELAPGSAGGPQRHDAIFPQHFAVTPPVSRAAIPDDTAFNPTAPSSDNLRPTAAPSTDFPRI